MQKYLSTFRSQRRVPTENKIQRQIVKYLKKQPDCWVYPTCDRFTVGVPDILGCLKGRFFALEVKQPTGRLSKIQTYNLALIKKAGGIAGRVASLKDTKALLDIE